LCRQWSGFSGSRANNMIRCVFGCLFQGRYI
jgi:hypothetical protein